jgi:poly(hydroxyalkanoate) depolymerase family esterase
VNPLFQKILSATGLTRQGRLVEATEAIQQALSGHSKSAPAYSGTVERRSLWPTGNAEAAGTAAHVIEGAVRETTPATDAGDPSPREADDAEVAVAPERPEPRPGVGGRFLDSSFTSAAGTRAFKLFQPAGFEGRSLPLVVMLHGCTQSPDDFAAGTRMNELAQQRGCFVLYPAQAPRSNAHKCWNWFSPGDQRRGQGEPALLAGMTRHVTQTHPVDADRVWVAGLSAGGAMAAILAREYPELFAAVGVHSGLPPGAAHDVVSAFSAMKSGAKATRPESSLAAAAVEAAPLIVFHGDADSTVHVVNGSRLIDAALGHAAPVIHRESDVGGADRPYTRTVYGDSARGSSAEHWLVHGAGHAWSGGAAAGSYTDIKGPDASAEMLRFFFEHPHRRAGDEAGSADGSPGR